MPAKSAAAEAKAARAERAASEPETDASAAIRERVREARRQKPHDRPEDRPKRVMAPREGVDPVTGDWVGKGTRGKSA
jgi:hypothetical protein